MNISDDNIFFILSYSCDQAQVQEGMAKRTGIIIAASCLNFFQEKQSSSLYIIIVWTSYIANMLHTERSDIMKLVSLFLSRQNFPMFVRD